VGFCVACFKFLLRVLSRFLVFACDVFEIYVLFFIYFEFKYINILSSTLELYFKQCMCVSACNSVCLWKEVCDFGYSMIPYIMDVIWKWVVDVIFHT